MKERFERTSATGWTRSVVKKLELWGGGKKKGGKGKSWGGFVRRKRQAQVCELSECGLSSNGWAQREDQRMWEIDGRVRKKDGKMEEIKYENGRNRREGEVRRRAK